MYSSSTPCRAVRRFSSCFCFSSMIILLFCRTLIHLCESGCSWFLMSSFFLQRNLQIKDDSSVNTSTKLYNKVKKNNYVWSLVLRLWLFTCDPWVALRFGCSFGVRPFPPDGRHLCGTLVGVWDAGTVLLVGACAAITVAQSVTRTIMVAVIIFSAWKRTGVSQLCLVQMSSAVCGYFLPLKPAWERRVSVEVKVPAAPVLLHHLHHPLFQVPAQLVVVHGAKQAAASRVSAPDGIHASLWSWSCDGEMEVSMLMFPPSLVRCQCSGHATAAACWFKYSGRTLLLFVHNEQRPRIGCSCSIDWKEGAAELLSTSLLLL